MVDVSASALWLAIPIAAKAISCIGTILLIGLRIKVRPYIFFGVKAMKKNNRSSMKYSASGHETDAIYNSMVRILHRA